MGRRSPGAEALALLGLAQRAGAVVKGTEATRLGLKGRRVRLVVFAVDGSEVQREKVLSLARAQGVPGEHLGSMDELGRAMGAGPLAAVGVTDARLATEIRKRLGRD